MLKRDINVISQTHSLSLGCFPHIFWGGYNKVDPSLLSLESAPLSFLQESVQQIGSQHGRSLRAHRFN